MNGQQLYELLDAAGTKVFGAAGHFSEPWDSIARTEQRWFEAAAVAIAEKLDPELARSALAERLASAECIIRQASNDTFGEELTPKEFAERSGYDS